MKLTHPYVEGRTLP